MKCPTCSGKIKTIDSRGTDNNEIRRRKVCRSCGHRFTTYELSVGGEQARTSKLVMVNREWYESLLKAQATLGEVVGQLIKGGM